LGCQVNSVDQPRVRRRLHAGAAALDASLDQFEPGRRDAPVFLQSVFSMEWVQTSVNAATTAP